MRKAYFPAATSSPQKVGNPLVVLRELMTRSHRGIFQHHHISKRVFYVYQYNINIIYIYIYVYIYTDMYNIPSGYLT